MQFWRYVALMGLAVLPHDLLAQDQCAEEGVILTLADTILADRAQVNPMQRRRIGAEAAYLKIAYGQPDEAAVAAMFADLLAEPMPDALELLATYTVSTAGVDEGLRILDPDPLRGFTLAGLSVRRAILLADDGQSYFSLLRSALDNPEIAADLLESTTVGIDMTPLVAGQPDEVLAELSQTAEAMGFYASALVIAAGMSTLDLYNEVQSRHPDERFVTPEEAPAWINPSGATLRHNTGPIPRGDPERQAERAQLDADFHATLRANYLDGVAQFSGTVINQTGWMAEGRIVADAFVTEVEAGRLDPARDPEAAWLFQYRAFAALKGRDAVHSTTGFFDFPNQRQRHFAGTALQSLDWMLAKEALRPYLAGETANLPTRPALLSDDFDWAMWTEVAGLLDADGADLAGEDPLRQRVALELLADSGRYDLMQSLAGTVLEPFDRLALFRDVMQRLDRHCAGWTAYPGEALFVAGNNLFRF